MLPLHENHVDFLSAKQSLSADIEFQLSLPVRGATLHPGRFKPEIAISIHAPHKGSDQVVEAHPDLDYTFQSTLPVRGATAPGGHRLHSAPDFNPRSPGGERRLVQIPDGLSGLFQSTLPGRGATPWSLFTASLPWEFQSTLPGRGATARPCLSTSFY